MQQDRQTILDLVQASQRIQLFILGMSFEDFQKDEKTQAAVLYQLLVLGEAVKRTSDALHQQYPAIPWSPIARMRDKLIHAYELVNLQEVWRTATADIPNLLLQLEQILSDNP